MSGYTSIVDATPMFVPGSFDGQDVRLATIGNCQPGLFAPGDFAVSQRAAGANASVDIAAGRAYVNPGTVVRQGSYVVWYGSTFNTSSNGGYTWTAADPTNPRIDLLCIEAADTDFGGSFTGWKWRVVDGTPNANATNANLRQYWPSIPSGCLPVAAIRIPANDNVINDADIYNINSIGGPAVMSRNGIQAFTGTGTIQADLGRIVTFTGAASQTITLPTAQVGMEFEVMNIDASDTVTLSRGGSDTFQDGATTSLVIMPGGRVRVRCLTSGQWNAENFGPIGCRLTAPTRLSDNGSLVATGTDTTLRWNTETFDHFDMHNTGSNQGRITIPVLNAGWYNVEAQMKWAAAATTGTTTMGLLRNGALLDVGDQLTWINSASLTTIISVDANYYMAAGDYFEILVNQTTGADKTISTGHFSVARVGR